MKLSEAQKILAGGLNLLEMDTDSKITVGLMLRPDWRVMLMLEWLYQNFKKGVYPTQEQVLDKAEEIYHMQQ